EQDSHYVRIACRHLPHGLQVIKWYTDESADQWFKTSLGLAVSCCRKRRQGTTMKRALHDDNGRIFHSLVMPIQACQLDGSLVGLTAGITDKYLVHPGNFAQLICQPGLFSNPIGIGNMDQAP